MLLRPQTLAFGVEGMLRECDTNCTHETKSSAREEDKQKDDVVETTSCSQSPIVFENEKKKTTEMRNNNIYSKKNSEVLFWLVFIRQRFKCVTGNDTNICSDA